MPFKLFLGSVVFPLSKVVCEVKVVLVHEEDNHGVNNGGNVTKSLSRIAGRHFSRVWVSKDPFPIQTDAYRGVTEDDIKCLSDGMALYGLNPYCDFPSADKEKYKAIYRLHQVWE